MKLVISLLLITSVLHTHAQYTLSLYDGDIPGAKPVKEAEKTEKTADGIVLVSKITQPTLTAYLPTRKKANGTAIIIFPGGGYRVNAIQHEGLDVAEYLAAQGIAAFVVKYRLPDAASMEKPERGPLQDALQAMRKVKQNAAQYGINPQRIGVMGFSAGGHLAASLSNLYRYEPDGRNLRPDFSILVYPVISFSDSVGHVGSREALLGKNPSAQQISYFSMEQQADANTPPAFLVHAKDDPVSFTNSALYAGALRKFLIPTELLSYEKGGHGYGMYNKQSDIFWPQKMMEWLRQQGFMK